MHAVSFSAASGAETPESPMASSLPAHVGLNSQMASDQAFIQNESAFWIEGDQVSIWNESEYRMRDGRAFIRSESEF